MDLGPNLGVQHGNPDRYGSYRRHPARLQRRDAAAVARAEERFKKLTSRGFTATVRSGNGETSVIRSFNPVAEETLFFPRIIGG
jgi:hypothetical protein